jgi:hypothetical protein
VTRLLVHIFSALVLVHLDRGRDERGVGPSGELTNG